MSSRSGTPSYGHYPPPRSAIHSPVLSNRFRFGTHPQQLALFEPLLSDQQLMAEWSGSIEGKLGLAILYCQLPRALYRGTARMFEHDAAAVAVARSIVDEGIPVRALAL